MKRRKQSREKLMRMLEKRWEDERKQYPELIARLVRDKGKGLNKRQKELLQRAREDCERWQKQAEEEKIRKEIFEKLQQEQESREQQREELRQKWNASLLNNEREAIIHLDYKRRFLVPKHFCSMEADFVGFYLPPYQIGFMPSAMGTELACLIGIASEEDFAASKRFRDVASWFAETFQEVERKSQGKYTIPIELAGRASIEPKAHCLLRKTQFMFPRGSETIWFDLIEMIDFKRKIEMDRNRR